MNYCNFVKVIISRSTKDGAAIDVFNKNKKEDVNQTNFIAHYNPSLAITQRYENYNIFMNKYKKLKIHSYNQFKQQCSRLQSYVTTNKYYKNNNHSGERNKFINYFSLQNWLKLNENEKGKHTLENCNQCNVTHGDASLLHKSYQESPLQKICKDLVNNLEDHNVSTSKNQGEKTVHTVVKMLEPVLEKTFDINFKTTLAEVLNLSPKESSAEKNQKIISSIKETKKQIESSFQSDDNDLEILLSTGKSFQQHDNERMKLSYISTEDAEKLVKTNQTKTSTGKKKSKNPIGHYDSYSFDKESFLTEVRQSTSTIMNWSRLARKYEISCKNKIIQNGGQVLANFARDNGVNIAKFNRHLKISGRDIIQRIRRPKRRVYKSKLSVPLQRSSKKLKMILKDKIASKAYNIGVKITPKILKNNIININGLLEETKTHIYGRKIPLQELIQNELLRLHKASVLRIRTDQEYSDLDYQTTVQKLKKLGIKYNNNMSLPDLTNLLKTTERTFHVKMWHDHSDILNHTYISFMASLIYDSANFLTNEELQITRPMQSKLNAQTIVERPNLYIFGQSGN
ncbi:unnamed protein product [Mytilus edulis]|uniref:Uncharacterized protein n=1 Tax=Mytilus edulis TaxID=6550 RepID=A0A8S3TYV3_MYTED|nr:unnamed protein product [Mytilus edulis]